MMPKRDKNEDARKLSNAASLDKNKKMHWLSKTQKPMTDQTKRALRKDGDAWERRLNREDQ